MPPAAPEVSKGWSEQDRRTLIITVIGGLVANLGTVILVGAAIALVRINKDHGQMLLLALISVAFGLVLIVFGSRALNRRGPDSWPRGAAWMLIAAGCLLELEAVLVLTGLAAGVK